MRAAVLGLALLAGACGGGDGGEASKPGDADAAEDAASIDGGPFVPGPGVFFGVWVESDPSQSDHKDVVYRLFSK